MSKLILCSMFFLLSLEDSSALEKNECTKNVKASSNLITGFGEGSTFQDAKAQALADAISFFGVSIESEQITDDVGSPEGPYSTISIKTRVSTLVKGGEILTQCVKDGTFQVVVGLKKSVIAAILEENAKRRTKWLESHIEILKRNADGLKGVEISKLKRTLEQLGVDDKTDVEAWILIGRPRQFYQSIPETLHRDFSLTLEKLSKSQKDESPMTISATDPIAEKTVPMLVGKLAQIGLSAVAAKNNTKADALWSCSLMKAMSIGESQRFSVRCSLSTEKIEFEPVFSEDIAAVTQVEETAVAKVSEKLMAH